MGCVCGEVHEDFDFWIQCELCQSWYSVNDDCIGFTEEEADSESWACDGCSEKKASHQYSKPQAKLVWEGPPDDEFGKKALVWPTGWLKRIYKRQSGASAGHYDSYWYSPKGD